MKNLFDIGMHVIVSNREFKGSCYFIKRLKEYECSYAHDGVKCELFFEKGEFLDMAVIEKFTKEWWKCLPNVIINIILNILSFIRNIPACFLQKYFRKKDLPKILQYFFVKIGKSYWFVLNKKFIESLIRRKIAKGFEKANYENFEHYFLYKTHINAHYR